MVARELLPQSVARKIQAMILSGELKAGAKVPSQRDFAGDLGISRASLREALLTLETLGLVRTEPGRGTFVSGEGPSAGRDMAPWRYTDRYPVFDVFETRIMLEGRIAGLSAASLAAAELDRLDRATDTMESAFAAGDLLANVEADLEFHGIVAGACRNAMLVDLYRSVRDQLTETQRQPIPKTAPARMRESIAEHRRIVEALRRRDGAAARRAMEEHIRNTARCAGILLD